MKRPGNDRPEPPEQRPYSEEPQRHDDCGTRSGDRPALGIGGGNAAIVVGSVVVGRAVSVRWYAPIGVLIGVAGLVLAVMLQTLPVRPSVAPPPACCRRRPVGRADDRTATRGAAW